MAAMNSRHAVGRPEVSTIVNTLAKEDKQTDNQELSLRTKSATELLPPRTTSSSTSSPRSEGLVSSVESGRLSTRVSEERTKSQPPALPHHQTTTEGMTIDPPDSLGDRNIPILNTLLVDYSTSHTGNIVDHPQHHDDMNLVTGSFVPHSRALSETFGKYRPSSIKNLLLGHSCCKQERLKAFLVVCAQVVVALLLTLLFLATLFANKSLRKYRYVNPISSADVCSNAACEMVVEVLTKSMELNVSPCRDFYRHSCGRWHARSHHRPSYISENSIAFHVRVQQSLEALDADRRLADSSSHRMAIFYASCKRLSQESRPPNFQYAIRLSGIDVSVWLGARSFQQLFATVVEECVRSGFASVISIQRSGQVVYVDSGRSIVRTMADERDKVASFMQAAFLALNIELNYSKKTAIEALDSTLDDALVSAFSEFQPTTIRQLPTRVLLFSWIQGLNGGLQNRSVVLPDSSVLARNLNAIRRVIWIMSSVEVRLASMYCLLLSLSQIMRYAYMLGGSAEDNRGTNFCLTETARRFPVQFPLWIAQTMETTESRDYVKMMVSTLGNVASEHSTVLDGLSLNSTLTEQLRNINVSIVTDMTGDVPADTGPPMVVDDFLKNVIRLSAERHTVNEHHWSWLSTQQLKGNLDYNGAAVIVPTMQLTGDLMHAEATSPMLDYSTVGVRILIEWAHRFLGKNPAFSAQMAAYRKCARERPNNNLLDGEVPDDTLRWMLLVPWALDVALVAAQMQSSAGEKDVHASPRIQLFFRRFCQTTCGDFHGAALCSYGTRHSKLFASAFGCRSASTLAC
ncbi:hypothetical protein MTO96_023664 [Rhipicephalus appendiculatus]